MRLKTHLVGITAMAIAGCASTPIPTERMEASHAAIVAAEEIGAPKIPSASLPLQLAKEEENHANQLIKSGDRQSATYVLMRAEADAELARALAREDRTRTAANQAIDRLNNLKSQ